MFFHFLYFFQYSIDMFITKYLQDLKRDVEEYAPLEETG